MSHHLYTNYKFSGGMVRGYDAFNHLASAGLDLKWRHHTARHVSRFLDGHPGPVKVLDLATGTADMAIAVRRAHEKVSICATDPSMEMLLLGRKKLGKVAGKAIFLINSVTRLALPDDSVDAVTCAFGFRNFIHLERDLQELYRVVKNGGRIYALEFYKPQTAFIGTLLQIYQKTVFPLVGYLVSRQTRSYKYLFSSILDFKTREEFSKLLLNTGFDLLDTKQFFFGLVHLIVAEKNQNS